MASLEGVLGGVERPHLIEVFVSRLSFHLPVTPPHSCSDDPLAGVFRYENDNAAPTRNAPAQI
jgi:hypothetical protein